MRNVQTLAAQIPLSSPFVVLGLGVMLSSGLMVGDKVISNLRLASRIPAQSLEVQIHEVVSAEARALPAEIEKPAATLAVDHPKQLDVALVESSFAAEQAGRGFLQAPLTLDAPLMPVSGLRDYALDLISPDKPQLALQGHEVSPTPALLDCGCLESGPEFHVIVRAATKGDPRPKIRPDKTTKPARKARKTSAKKVTPKEVEPEAVAEKDPFAFLRFTLKKPE